MSTKRRLVAFFMSLQLLAFSTVAQVSGGSASLSREQSQALFSVTNELESFDTFFVDAKGEKSDLLSQVLGQDGIRVIAPLENGARAGLLFKGELDPQDAKVLIVRIAAYDAQFKKVVTARTLRLNLTSENTIANHATLVVTEQLLYKELEFKLKESNLFSLLGDLIFPKAYAQSRVEGLMSICIAGILLIAALRSKSKLQGFALIAAGIFALSRGSMQMKGWGQ